MDIFSKIDENIKEEEILQMFKECDLDNDGFLNYEEFKRMIRNKFYLLPKFFQQHFHVFHL